MTDTAAPPAEHVVVETPSGSVRGRIRSGGSIAFLGVPYAEPPVGALRYLAPEPRAPWGGVLDALEYGPTPQRRALAEITSIPEPSIPGDDTLSVNVFTPDTAPAEPLPVLVYVHGGGYIAGSPASPWYDGAAFNRDRVVVVVVSYRLGFDGYGWLPDAPQNRAVLDQLLALRWVRTHIGAFGGDPDRVTIGGQSAGAGSVLALLASPAAVGLFRGVVSLSGAISDVSLEVAQEKTEAMAEQLGVPATRAGFASVPEAAVLEAQGGLFAGLDDPSADALVGIAEGVVGGLAYCPVVDGDLLPKPVATAIRDGAGADVPLLIGTTADEFTGLFLAFASVVDPLDAAALLGQLGLAPETAQRYVTAMGDAPSSAVLGRWTTDARFRRLLVEVVAARAGAAAGTWAYDFTYRGANGIAEHCLDVPFVFDVLADPAVARIAGAAPPQELADVMHAAVVRFVTTGDPGWSTAATGETMRFDERSGPVRGAYRTAELLGA